MTCYTDIALYFMQKQGQQYVREGCLKRLGFTWWDVEHLVEIGILSKTKDDFGRVYRLRRA